MALARCRHTVKVYPLARVTPWVYQGEVHGLTGATTTREGVAGAARRQLRPRTRKKIYNPTLPRERRLHL